MIVRNQKKVDEEGNLSVTGMVDDIAEEFGRLYRNKVEKNVLKSMNQNKKGTSDWQENEKVDRVKVKEMFDSELVKLKMQKARP